MKIKILSLFAFLSLTSLIRVDASELMLFDSLSVQGNGLAGCISSLEGTIDSITANPAGLGSIKSLSSSASYMMGVEETGHMNFSFGIPLQPKAGTLAASFSTLFIDNLPSFDAAGIPLSDIPAGDLMISLGWGKEWNKFFSAGVSTKWTSTHLAEFIATAVAFDVGIQSELFYNFRAGFALQNLGAGQKFVETSSSLPMKIRGGVNYKFIETQNIDSSFMAECVKERDKTLRTSFGLENTIYSLISLRVGYKLGNVGEYKFSTGMSLHYNIKNLGFSMDYALLPSSVFNHSHSFGLRLTSGFTGSRSAIPDENDKILEDELNNF